MLPVLLDVEISDHIPHLDPSLGVPKSSQKAVFPEGGRRENRSRLADGLLLRRIGFFEDFGLMVTAVIYVELVGVEDVVRRGGNRNDH